jgi:hypothetical protein
MAVHVKDAVSILVTQVCEVSVYRKPQKEESHIVRTVVKKLMAERVIR